MSNGLAIVSEKDIKNKIYVIRGKEVILDSDLAKIYGYTTKDFNRQVKNNIERFDDDFRFQLNEEDIKQLSRCKNFTLNKSTSRDRIFIEAQKFHLDTNKRNKR